ncbi:hypothetical protein TAMC210_17190 [Thermanaeromonas sp. C210]|nr:hypothetical protein TAMC210_17190 [Thermanaeromonas sp. C210]
MFTPENIWTLGEKILFPIQIVISIIILISIFREYKVKN